MKRKFLSLLLAVVMLVTAFPMATVTVAGAATDDVKLYDAHITGNVVVGGTLTANFKPALDDADLANLCPGLDVEKTKASIKWYARNRFSNRNSKLKNLSNDGKTEYTIPADFLTTYSDYYGIFFSVTPTDASGNALGKTIVSNQMFNVAAINSDATEPSAYNVVILPQNGDGILNVGKTVAARFSFRYPKSASIGNGNSLYEWYTSESLLKDDEMASATVVEASSTDPYYTIKPADAGKWLYVKVTPVASDGATGSTSVYSRNHLANPFLGYEAKDITSSNFNSSTTYPNVKSLADGAAPATSTGGTSMSTFMMSYNQNADTVRSVTLDAGEIVPFDHFYLRNVNANIKTLKMSYSAQENVESADIEWIDVINQTDLALVAGPREFDCNELLYGRYFKLEFTHVKNNAIVDEFYPFLKNDAWFEGYSDSKIASFNDNVIVVESLNIPLSELHKKENGFTLKSDYDAEGTTTYSDEIIANNISYVTKSVTSDGDVYTAIENPENVYVTEDTENTYMKITGINGVSQYVEISLDAKITTSIDYTNSMFATLTDNVIKVEAWGTPLTELHKKANGFVLTSDDDVEGSTENADKIIESGISYVTKSVTYDGDVYTAIENPENVYITEATENTFMKITGTNGVSQYIEVTYSGNDLPEIATEKEIEGAAEGSATRHPIGTVYFAHRAADGYASGKYLMKTQIYLPDYSRVELKVKQGGTGMTGGQMRNILFFMGNATPYAQGSGNITYYQGDIGVPKLDMDTGFNYRVDNWYDLEVLFDYDKIDRAENEAISISAWVDGIQVVDEAVISCADAAAKDRISPAFITYPNTGLTGVKMKNSSFRQVWDADTHVTKATTNELKIINAADENAESVTTVSEGSFTLSNTMNVYEGNGIVDYIAKYYVTGDGSTELVSLSSVSDMATDFVTVTADELADESNKVVLKAISFKNGLTPNYTAVTITE